MERASLLALSKAGQAPALQIRVMVIKTIAINALKEAIRDKILYNLLIFTVILMAASMLIGRLTIGEDQRVIKDIGLAAMSLFGVLIATFVGTSLVHKEIRKKTIYTIISKPIRRYEFIMGKYCGLLLTIFVNLIIMTFALFAVLVFHRAMFPYSAPQSSESWGIIPVGFTPLLKAVALILLELMVVTSIAILFSTISTPTLSVFFTLAIYVIGHLTVDLKELGAASKSNLLKGLCSSAYYILPNLENFNIRAEMVRGLSVGNRFVFYAIVYGVLYIAAVTTVCVISIERKEFV